MKLALEDYTLSSVGKLFSLLCSCSYPVLLSVWTAKFKILAGSCNLFIRVYLLLGADTSKLNA